MVNATMRLNAVVRQSRLARLARQSCQSRLACLTLLARLACLTLLASGTMLACGTPSPAVLDGPERFRITGSTTMNRLVRQWTIEYMNTHPGVFIDTESGSSRFGIESLIAGKTEIGAASRTMLPDEVKRLQENRGSLGMSILTARDALSIYVHRDNPVRDLSIDEVRAVFSGKIENWRQVGGKEAPVLVVNRPPNSGTRVYFDRNVLQLLDFSTEARIVPTSRAVVEVVARNPNAIGYGGIGLEGGTATCSIDGVYPTAATVRDGTYPLIRYLYFYIAHSPRGAIKSFVDWILSDEGQAVVERAGYVPLWEPGK